MDIDEADVKATIKSFCTVGIMALLFLVGGKWVLNRWKVAGLTELFNAA
jgi:hypothetical protein